MRQTISATWMQFVASPPASVPQGSSASTLFCQTATTPTSAPPVACIAEIGIPRSAATSIVAALAMLAQSIASMRTSGLPPNTSRLIMCE